MLLTANDIDAAWAWCIRPLQRGLHLMTTAIVPASTHILRNIDDVQDFKNRLFKLGYYTKSPDLVLQLFLAISDMALTSRPISALNLDGPPGTGKTHAAYTIAKMLGAQLLQFQFTVGVGREVMMHDMDIAAVVSAQVEGAVAKATGTTFTLNREDLIIPGILQQALSLSHEGKVVLLLDEIDKAKPYVDSMLLQFLQECSIAHPTKRGEVLQGNPNNLLVFLTKNNERGLSEPLMRRCRSVYLKWPDVDTEKAIVKKLALNSLSGVPFKGDMDALVTFIVGQGTLVRQQEATLRKVPSSPELAQAIVDAVRVPKEHRGVVICRQLFKYREDYDDYLKSAQGSDREVSESKVRALLPAF